MVDIYIPLLKMVFILGWISMFHFWRWFYITLPYNHGWHKYMGERYKETVTGYRSSHRLEGYSHGWHRSSHSINNGKFTNLQGKNDQIFIFCSYHWYQSIDGIAGHLYNLWCQCDHAVISCNLCPIMHVSLFCRNVVRFCIVHIFVQYKNTWYIFKMSPCQ